MASEGPGSETPIETTFLIVGAGPAGASLACFLASYGFKGIIIAAAPGTAKEPRAHITNAAALECLRDIGLEADILRNATSAEHLQHTRWCRSMTGAEFARVHSWGHQPHRQADYRAASPCRHVDLPQTLLEPVLVRYAVTHGWTVRFQSSFVAYARDEPPSPAVAAAAITSTVRDELTGHTYAVRSKYLFGCDGARSQVIRQLDLPLRKEPGQGLAINLLVEADLSEHMRHRVGNLHWVFTPELEHPAWGWACLVRMVQPWHQWMFIMFPEPGFEDFGVRPSIEEYTARARQIVGDESIPLKIVDVSKWYVNEIMAERYSDGNIFCMGDAVHRHPPFNGLGSNTCIQDAWNLAWKLAFVEQGRAGPRLLETFSDERQPIGAGIVKRANQGLRDHLPVFEALGVLPKVVAERRRQHEELAAPTRLGQERRKKLREAIAGTENEFGGIGIEMNQRYVSSAVDVRDEEGVEPPVPRDEILEYRISTYPGSRLPHAWINERGPVEPISTIDLAGHGAFCVLTGNGGDGWKTAAEEVAKSLGIPITTHSIGWMQDWEDVYGDWSRRREIEDDGCLLVRPDRTICWRSMTIRKDCRQALLDVISAVLGRDS